MKTSISFRKNSFRKKTYEAASKEAPYEKKRRLRGVVLPLIFWLGLWWAFAALVDQELLLPNPWRVAQELAVLAVTAEFWQSVGMSLVRIFCGALCGVVLGVLTAVVCCTWEWVDELLAPIIRIIRATPVAGFIILVLLWVRTGVVPGVISALMVLPIIWESVCAGIRAADPALLEMARVYRMERWRVVRYIYLPTVRPLFVAGICTSIGLAWKSGVAAEVLCLPKAAIGANVYFSKIYLETPSLFAWCIVVIILSLLLESIIKRMLER